MAIATMIPIIIRDNDLMEAASMDLIQVSV